MDFRICTICESMDLDHLWIWTIYGPGRSTDLDDLWIWTNCGSADLWIYGSAKTAGGQTAHAAVFAIFWSNDFGNPNVSVNSSMVRHLHLGVAWPSRRTSSRLERKDSLIAF